MKNRIILCILLSGMATTAGAKSLSQSSISLDQATSLASAAIKSCSAKGYNVSVSVVDNAGLTRAVQRMDNAGPHTLEASYKKAYTAASSGLMTSQLLETSQKYPAASNLSDIPGFLLLAGGVPVKENDKVIGAIGIGGAPNGNIDEACALNAIKQVL
ncbi:MULTISPECIES: GlcG/HbpS family heme-binding protein [Serratia]|uniref:GlcG/HbpS family heme-binding protein n=1 Tax=Serratia TaxID=613 RepID=UPI002ECFDE06|nr:heme-binding protein [Serratia sp. C2(2)]MEE4449846.1 heme-binding protein [Serratia sp. C2(1)]